MRTPILLLSLAAGLVACATTCPKEPHSRTSVIAAPAAPPAAPPTLATPAAPIAAVAAASSVPRLGVAEGENGAVSVAEPLAATIGLDVLKEGGNAVDAAVAIGFALAVTHPTAGNIGGGGFMVLRSADGSHHAIDYREAAPAAASADMYLDAQGTPTKDSVIGARAAGIPGTVAGLALAHRKFGQLPWARLLQPAITLARKGHRLDSNHAKSLSYAVMRMRSEGLTVSVPYFSRPDGTALQPGDLWQQADLARTLQLIADGGPQAFYQGPFAAALARQVRDFGGIWSADDLAKYQPKERAPLAFDYLGHRIVAMPPPSAGGVVLQQILTASELLHIGQLPYRSVGAEHLYLEAARRAYADRNYLLGDPDFVDVPTAQLTARAYIAERMANIDPQHATPSDQVNPGLPPQRLQESHDTTHYSVVDRLGNAVANTYTLNTSFGSKLLIPGTGVLLNNEMDDFAAKPGEANVYGLVQGQNNRIEPGKRMLSSMTPTIVEKDGKLRAVVGTPGGPTITTTVAQIVRALVDHRRPLWEAVEAPRLHHQWQPDQVFVEASTEATLVEGLEALGHKVVRSPYGPIGHANCIEVVPENGKLRAVADVTRGKGGAALAY